MQNARLNLHPADTDATATITTPAPKVVDQGATVEITLSAVTSFGALNVGDIIRCEDAEDAAKLIGGGIARASDKQPGRVMPSTAKQLAKEAAARAASGDDVTVLQGFDPDVHPISVETAKAQRDQEEKASQPAERKRGRK